MIKPDRLNGIAAFVSTAEAGNFSAAAERMALSRSAVAKSVARLEERIQTRLFHRTTRSLSLTEEGLRFYQHCLRILAELEQAEDSLTEGLSEVSGRISITMPGLLGRCCVAPLLFDLVKRHPGLRLNLSFTDRRIDLIDDGFDLAIRSGALPDNHDYQARFLGTQRMVLCASRTYLDRKGWPSSLSGLADFDGIVYGKGKTSTRWRFEGSGGGECLIEIPARICMDDLATMLDAVHAGLGVALLPVWLVHSELNAGNIVQLLPEELAVGLQLNLLWPASKQYSRRLRLVIDMLAVALPGVLGDNS